MAVTQTTDITTFNETMADVVNLLALRKLAFINSPAFQTDPMLANELLATRNGTLAPRSLSIPHLSPLPAGSSVISDNPADIIVGKKISGGKSTVYPAFRAVSPQSTGLAQHFGGYSITDVAANQLADFWAGELETMVLSALKGIFAYNATATDAKHTQNSMIKDVSGSTYESGVTDLNFSTFLRAKAEIMGEQGNRIVCMVVHSVVAAGLGIQTAAKQQVNITPGGNPNQAINYGDPIPQVFGNTLVIVSDSVPAVDGVYTSYFLGVGSLMAAMTPFAQSNLPALVAMPDQAGANGGGVAKIYSRTALAVHPVGFSFLPPVGMSDGGPTPAHFETAANWQQEFTEQKRIALMAIVTREHA